MSQGSRNSPKTQERRPSSSSSSGRLNNQKSLSSAPSRENFLEEKLKEISLGAHAAYGAHGRVEEENRKFRKELSELQEEKLRRNFHFLKPKNPVQTVSQIETLQEDLRKKMEINAKQIDTYAKEIARLGKEGDRIKEEMKRLKGT